MGRRSRQRTTTSATARRREAPPTVAAPKTKPVPPAAAARPGRRDAAPRPPWGDFPLVELSALAAIVLGVWGILAGGAAIQLTVAALLGSVAGLEVALREHLAGYRSHTLVLSGACTVATVTLLFFVGGLQRPALIPIAGGVLVLALGGFRLLFKRRSGGYGFRVR
jgi:hypothetical protein